MKDDERAAAESDINDCQVRVISPELMDCLVKKDCTHALPFGHGRFCRHPLRHLIRNQPHKKA